MRARFSLVVAALWLVAGCASTAPPGPSASSSPPTPAPQRVSGTVLGEPGCPGPVRLGSACPPKPMAGSTVEVMLAGRVVASAVADASGGFELFVGPGSYTITAKSAGPLGSKDTKDLVVGAVAVTIDLTVDTGIR